MSKIDSTKETLSVREAAAALGVSRGRMYASVRCGEIPMIRLGRRIVLSKRVLERLLDGSTDSATRSGAERTTAAIGIGDR